MNTNFFAMPLACFLLVTMVHAATLNNSGKPDSGRLVRFVQTSIPDDLENPVKILVGGEIKIVTLSNSVASLPVKIPEDGVLRLVKELPDPKNQGKTIYETLAKAIIPKGVKNALVIMAPMPDRAKNGMVFMCRIQPLDSFKGGDFLYINLTKSNIGIEISKDKFGLKPGDTKIHDVKGGDQIQSVPYRYSYFDAGKQKWKTLNASMTIASPTRRELFVFSVSSNTGRIRCKGVTIPVQLPHPTGSP